MNGSTGRTRCLALLVAAVAAAAGCGGSSSPKKVPAADYVNGVCGALRAYEQSAQTLTAQIGPKVQAAEQAHDNKGVRDNVASLLSSSVTQLNALKSSVDKLGAPSVTGGAAIRTAVSRGVAQQQADVTNARDKVTKLDPTSSTFLQQLQAIGSAAQQGTGLSGSNALGSPALATAVRNDRVCQSLQASPGASPGASASPSSGG